MRVNNSSVENKAIPLVDEVRFRMYLNGIYYSDFYCTPEFIKELAIGNLYINCNIHDASDIEKIAISGYKIDVETAERRNLRENDEPVSLNMLPEMNKLVELTRLMFDQAEIYSLYGGIHCSALSDGNELVAFKEDIGRHNAFDKVVGTALLKGLELNSLIYITSGRVNHEVMTKAASCSLPLIVSRSIMSSAAYELGERRGIKVIGRILSPEPVNYGGSEYRCLKR